MFIFLFDSAIMTKEQPKSGKKSKSASTYFYKFNSYLYITSAKKNRRDIYDLHNRKAYSPSVGGSGRGELI